MIPETEAGAEAEAISTEIMDRFLASEVEREYEQVLDKAVDDESQDENIDPNDEVIIPAMAEYRKLIFDDPGYSWLLYRLKNEFMFSTPGKDVIGELRDKILDRIPRVKHFSKNNALHSCTVIYRVDWDPRFFLEQEYGNQGAEIFAKAMTLTGCSRQAQALSCREYLAQTWPMTGPHTERLIQDLLRDTNGNLAKSREYVLPDQL